MNPEPEKEFSFSTIIIGVVGLLVVAWGAFSYLQGHGFFKGSGVGATSSGVIAMGNTINAASSSITGYAAIGQLAQAKTVAVGDTVSQANAESAAQINVIPVLPYKAPAFNGAAWIYDWGAASITNNALSFGAATSSTGGDLFLASSSAWINYAISANVDWQAGTSFGIIARLSDPKDFVYCDFADKTASIVRRTNGDDATILEGAAPTGGAGTEENFGISVYGNDVACTVNGNEVLGAAIVQNEPANGGIGLISWDATPGVSRILVNSFSAVELSTNLIAAPFLVPIPNPTTTATAQAGTTATATSTTATSTTTATTPIATLNLPYTETDFANDANWQKNWGAMTIDSSNLMDIGSAADTSGGTTILQNTNGWINYRFTTTVDWLKGETFMVIGRYADANDYVACEFVRDPNVPGAATIELEKFVNGNEATLQTGEDMNFSREGDTNIAIVLSLQGPQATCSFNNHTISNTGSNSYAVSPIAGGIGFSTWDPTLGNTEIVVRQVSVAGNYQ